MARTYDYDMGILGGGATGLTVAAGSAQLGAKTILIEKESALGGDCLHYSCVPSKTLIRTGQVYHEMKHAERFGLPTVDVPPVDYRKIAGRIRSVIHRIQKHDSEERFCRLGTRVVFGEAHFVDEYTVRLNGQRISAKYWTVATGSSPAVPSIEGLDRTPYLTNRDLFSLDRLPRSLISLGGGPIGIEMAQAFNRLGTRVQVVEQGGQILSKEDGELADRWMAVRAREGIVFHLNATIQEVRDLGAKRQVVIQADDGRMRASEAEAILVAAGRTANVEGLGLENIEVACNHRGVKVDEQLRTLKHKHIFAAGDVTGSYLFTHAAGYESSVVMTNALFKIHRKADYTLLPWCTYTQPELASIGMNETRAGKARIDYKVHAEDFAANDRSLAEGEDVGRVKLILDGKERPLGVQTLGPHAGDLVSEWVAALAGGVKLSTMAAAVHPYPTFGEINERVAGNDLSEKIFSDKVKKTLKFFYGFKGRACGPAPEGTESR